ncbi:MAG: hypothetical protein ACU85E_08105 [Gammaproteobacteria bacterium]
MGSVQAVTSIVTAIAAILGFIGLIVQLKKLECDLQVAARGSIYDMAARLKEIFVDNPEMRKYFFDGVSISEDAEHYPKAIAIADYFCLYLEQISTQSANIAPEHRESWLFYAAAIDHNSSIIKNYLSDKRFWYAPDFWDTVESYPQKRL